MMVLLLLLWLELEITVPPEDSKTVLWRLSSVEDA
jgi:hypothetical protein